MELAVRIALADSMAPRLREGPQDHNMDSPRYTARLVRVPGRSAALIMEALRWRVRPVGDRASEEGPMAAGGMGAEVEGSSPFLLMKDTTKCSYGGNNHAQGEQKIRNR
jgi:hypothetical protein